MTQFPEYRVGMCCGSVVKETAELKNVSICVEHGPTNLVDLLAINCSNWPLRRRFGGVGASDVFKASEYCANVTDEYPRGQGYINFVVCRLITRPYAPFFELELLKNRVQIRGRSLSLSHSLERRQRLRMDQAPNRRREKGCEKKKVSLHGGPGKNAS